MTGSTSIRTWTAACAVACLLALAGCENAKNALGMTKQAPDEFAVVTRAPLSIPPDFGLRPPQPGAERPQEQTPRNRARELLLGRQGQPDPQAAAEQAVASGKYARGEAAILQRAGALDADPSIRQKIDSESTAIAASERGFMDNILFWQERQPPGQIVDAAQEARRLREAAALGDAPNKGDVPVIERRERGWLEGIF